MLRDRFLWADHDGAYTLPESVNRSFVADALFNTFTFTANNTWEVFETDCTTYVTTGGWVVGSYNRRCGRRSVPTQRCAHKRRPLIH